LRLTPHQYFCTDESANAAPDSFRAASCEEILRIPIPLVEPFNAPLTGRQFVGKGEKARFIYVHAIMIDTDGFRGLLVYVTSAKMDHIEYRF